MYADKPVPVVNLQPVRFIGNQSNQGRTGKINGEWDPDRSVVVVTSAGVPVEEEFLYIGINARISVINLECDC